MSELAPERVRQLLQLDANSKQLERCVQDEEGEDVRRWKKAMSRSVENIIYSNIKRNGKLQFPLCTLPKFKKKNAFKCAWRAAVEREEPLKRWDDETYHHLQTCSLTTEPPGRTKNFKTGKQAPKLSNPMTVR